MVTEEFKKLRVRCPRCRDWVSWENTPTRPFCSEQCKNTDLGNWATERYKIPAEDADSGADVPDDDEKD